MSKTTNYQCNGSKVSWLKPPEGAKVTCPATGSIISPGAKCTVACDSGSPKYKDIQCKAVGWRPSDEVVCEGVNAGVIIGVLIGGLVAVVILAIVYAKYKQKQKEKRGISTKVQNGKISQNARRPGQSNLARDEVNSHRVVIETPPVAQQPKLVSQSKSCNAERPRSHHKSSDHHDSEDSKHNTRSRDAPKSSHHKKRRREHPAQHHSQEHQATPQQAYNSNYQGYCTNGTTGHVVMPQVGYHNSAYYQQGQSHAGYGTTDPAVGYTRYTHPQSYPSRTYKVPT